MPDAETSKRLRSLPWPAYEVVVNRTYTPAEMALARRGIVTVHDRKVNISPPIDWQMDGPPSFQAHLHSLFFFDILLKLYVNDRDRDALEFARRAALDWIRSNPLDGSDVSVYAWNDKATGDRAPYLAFLLRAAAHNGDLSDADALRLMTSLHEHGRALADETRYASGTNHGLFQDQGLLLLAKYMAPLFPDAEAWHAVALERLRANINAHVSSSDKLWLEHSVAYHIVIVNLLYRLKRWQLIDDRELDLVADEMADAAGWLVAPDGNLAQIGDTDLRSAPAWAAASAASKDGLKMFGDGGWVVVKRDASYLITAASFHSTVHKHADELSFELIERGRRIVVDTGFFAYDSKDPHRRYARSLEAHNGLMVDGGYAISRLEPYGSGIVTATGADGWYTIEATNPLVEIQGVRHMRIYRYRPDEILVVEDTVMADEPHTYTRYFHLGPGIDVDGTELRAASGEALGTLENESPEGTRRIVKGQRDPMQGWTFPAHREAIPINTVIYETKAANATMVATFRSRARLAAPA
jgi:hypothetical protein